MKFRDRLKVSEFLFRIVMVKLMLKGSDEFVFVVLWYGFYINLGNEEKKGVFKIFIIFFVEVIKEKGIFFYIIGGDFNLNLLVLDIELVEDVIVLVYELSDC